MPDLISNLACPFCRQPFYGIDLEAICSVCNVRFPVLNGIPRFVPKENYADSFGLQWNRFATTQIDSKVGTNRSELRFINETLWNEETLKGKLVLDAGCGSGRFSEIALKFGANLIAVDYSSAVDAARRNLTPHNNLIVQGNLELLPISNETFDFIYCIGVLQHTSRPDVIIRELLRCLKIGGEMTLTFYENSSWHVLLYSKYLIRPITKRINKLFLLKLISYSSFLWFPVTKILFSLPKPISTMLRFIIPIANYVEFEYRSKNLARDEAVLDTFDMLSPSYDKPIKKSTLITWLEESDMNFEILDSTQAYGTVRLRKTGQ